MACVVCHKIYSPNNESPENSEEKPHLCTTCGLSFTFKIQLKRHMILHADGAPYTCKYCVKDSEDKGKTYNLRLGNKSENSCEVCHKNFSNKRALLRHSIQHTYDTEDGFEERIKITIKKRVAHHNSKRPKKTSDTEPVRLSLKRHWSYNSSKSKTLVCDICNKSFAYQACLDKHIKMGKCSLSSLSKESPMCKEFMNAHKDKPVPNSCEDLNNKNNLSKDTEKAEIKKHACSICGKTFARKSSLDGHELSHILNKEASEDERYFSESDEDFSQPKKSRITTFKFQKSFTCDKCNFVCFSKQTLSRHMTNHKESPSEIDNNVQEKEENSDSSSKKNSSNKLKSFKDLEKIVGEISYKCEKCKKKFKNETKLLKHNCLHDKVDNITEKKLKKNLNCEVCNETFDSKKDLKHHLLSHIEGNTDDSSLDRKELFSKYCMKRSKNFACEICGRRFAGAICLKKHQLKHKEDAKNTETSSFPTTTPRVRKSKPVKELVCEYCNEEFTGKKSAYIKHIHAHTPEVCGICDDRFVDRQSLREHCKIHIGTEEGRMFMQCSQKALDAKNGLLAPEPKVEYIYLVLR